MKKVELLAPAGSYESFLGAVCAGADAVYIGGQRYGARAYAENFTDEEICLAIRYAHLFGKKLYLTVNTLVKEEELWELPAYLRPFYEEGLDGVIVQDMGVFSLLRECFPLMELHGSTQMTVTGARGARFLLEQGATRVVPARELSLKEIAEIKQTGIEVEAFIHGAMCYCYSGQCLLSSMLGGRSGNRGRCAQPCRLPYQIEGEKKESYPLSMKDMCTLSFLPELLNAGIDSFKIEGRMKKPEYAAGVTALYRRYIDRYYENPDAPYRVEAEDMKKLRSLYIRSEIQEGYYHRHNGKEMITPYKPSYLGADEAYLRQIRETYLEKLPKISVKGQVKLKKDSPAQFTLSVSNQTKEEHEVSCRGAVVLAAQKQPLNRETVEKQLKKTGNTVFELSELSIEMEKDCFLPIKALNDLRREAFAYLEQELTGAFKREKSDVNLTEPKENTGAKWAQAETGDKDRAAIPYFSVQLISWEQFEAVYQEQAVNRLYIEADLLLETKEGQLCELFNRLAAWKAEKNGRKLMLTMPVIIRLRDEAYLNTVRTYLENPLWDGVMIRNLEELIFLRDIGCQKELAADTGLYAWNGRAKQFWKDMGISYVSAPLECNKQEWKKLGLTDSEVVVYGKSMLMVSANCIRRTAKVCLLNKASKDEMSVAAKQDAAFLYLKDRYHTEFPVRFICRHCYNEMYNSVPLSLHEYGRSILGQKPCGIRLSFTTENKRETMEVMQLFHSFLSEPCRERCAAYAYTRGHYKRGAE